MHTRARTHTHAPPPQVNARICSISWTADGAYLALGCFDGAISIRDKGGSEKHRIETGAAPVWSISWNPLVREAGRVCVCAPARARACVRGGGGVSWYPLARLGLRAVARMLSCHDCNCTCSHMLARLPVQKARGAVHHHTLRVTRGTPRAGRLRQGWAWWWGLLGWLSHVAWWVGWEFGFQDRCGGAAGGGGRAGG